MELIHLQEDLERDGFPSGLVPPDVAFWCFEHMNCVLWSKDCRSRFAPCRFLEVSFDVRPSKQCPEGLGHDLESMVRKMLDVTQNSNILAIF